MLDEIKFAVQINGKTKDVIEIIKNMSQAEVEKIIQENMRIKKIIKDKNIVKTIFVKNKIINYIVK